MGVKISGAPAQRGPRPFFGNPAFQAWIAAASLITLLFTCIAVYWPGLSGSFLFDDYGNLNALGAYGGIHGLDSALQFILGGQAGPTGRPVALASFLLDAVDWPASPFPFKYDNLLFHLVTGLLLGWLALKLARALHLKPRQAAWTGVLSAGLWLLHPFFVSTVLYPVQRMAILAALFAAAGLALYAAGRLNLAESNARAGFIKASIGVGLFTPLAAFSKENGALLPLLALALEGTVLTASPVAGRLRRPFRWWKAVFLYLPLLVLALHFALGWHGVLGGYHSRAFTFGQRLMSEPRILMNYLGHLVIPRMQTAGLYHDDYPLSTGLLHPPATLAALLALAVAFGAALVWRRRYPVLALAVLFFLAGQLLESSFISLELYYEHRSYLPSMMAFFALGYYLVRYARRAPRLAVPLAVVLLASFAGLTYARSSLWGNLDELALVWARQNPVSRRTQQQAAIIWAQRGRPLKGLAHIETALRYHPRNAILRLQMLSLHCGAEPISREEFESTRHWLHRDTYNQYTYRNLKHVIDLKRNGHCPQLTVEKLLSLDRALRANPTAKDNHGARQKLLYARGRLLLMQNQKTQAETALTRAFQAQPTVGSAMQFTGLLATHGDYDAALKMLHNAEFVLRHAKKSLNPATRLSIEARHYPSELKRIRKNILAARRGKEKGAR